MTQQRTQPRRTDQTREPSGSGPAAEGNKQSLLAQAQGFGEVARQSRRDCPRGSEAEKEAAARKNNSGQ